MGWTSYHATHYMANGQINRKAECDAYFMEGLNRGHFHIEKSTMVGAVYYAAVRGLKRYVKETETYEDIPLSEQRIFGIVFLTSIDNKDYYNFSYKDMDESMGPCYHNCPESILRLLSPTDSEYANEWRDTCRKHAKAKKMLNAVSVGTTIHFFLSGKEVKLIKRAPAYQFKTPWWYNPESHTYMKQNQIPLDFTLQTN